MEQRRSDQDWVGEETEFAVSGPDHCDLIGIVT